MLSATNTSEWQLWTARGEIPRTTEEIKLEIIHRENGECLLDNIAVHLRRSK